MSSEEVLLTVGHIKNKKCEGTLYMMGQRMAWMPQGKNTFTISHNYADIRIQKISPDSKDKVQLQVVMHDGSANTFHFASPAGRQEAAKERESIKEVLQQLLPKFRRKVNSELEKKNRMLQEDPELFQLYKDLVVSGVVTPDEFWANRNAGNNSSSGKNCTQEIGISQAFLADIKPQTDGCNGLKYNLTSDIIESIFRTYPAVKSKHAECVPDKLTEQDFWTRFFQSHYFHRDRINLGNKDLFADCAKSDEQDIQTELEKPVSDLLVDLGQMSDATLGEGYGLSGEDSHASTNPSNASLIKRFNQHSTMVLRACDKRISASASAAGGQGNGHNNTSNGTTNNTQTNGPSTSKSTTHTADEEDQPPVCKKAKVREKINLDDLHTKEVEVAGPSLRLVHMDRYLHGPTPITATHYNTGEDILHSCQAVTQEMLAWHPRLTHSLPSVSAMNVLGELSPGGALMQGHTQQQLHHMVSEETQAELKNQYNALCELLRHFWSCFPATTKFLEEKVLRMMRNLERFQMAKLNPLKDKMNNLHFSMNLIGHMESLIEAAHNKFNVWQMKRMNKKS